VGKSLKKYYELYKPSIIIITHSNYIINLFDNIKVHIIDNGSLVQSGDKTLIEKVLDKGFKEINGTNVISES